MNKYEREQLETNLDRLKTLETSLEHLSLRHFYVSSPLSHVKTAKEEIESILRIVDK